MRSGMGVMKNISKIKNDEVSEITTQGSYITGKLNDKNKTEFKTYLPQEFRFQFYENYLKSKVENNTLKYNGKAEPTKPFYLEILPTLIILVGLGVLWFLFMKQAQGGGKVMNFGKSKARLHKDKKNEVTFADVAGLEEEKEELQEIVDFLKSPKKYSDIGARIPKGVLMVGPPGTGKTYQTVNYAVAIIEGKLLEDVQAENHEEVLKRYRQYRQDGRIEFTTFHQSFGYEDFIEGIRPKFFGENEEEAGEIQYEITKGIFKAFCLKAQIPIADAKQSPYGFSDTPSVWKVSLGGTGGHPLRNYCMQNDCIRIGWDEYGETVTDETNYFVGGKYVLNAFLNRMQLGDIVLSCYSARTIDAIGVITGDPEWLPNEDHYKRSRKVNWLLKGKKIDIEEFQLSRSLVQSTVYQLDTTAAEVIKVLEKNGFAPTTAVETKPYVFIIDEINRGNISKIFGELITLIEPSKRLGQSEGLQVRLPYSQKLFGIPDNVYLLGTMNTADRSIAMLDTALRRRFSFTEMMPDSGVLDGVEVEGISISGLITTLNRRIEVLFDREHTLGHAFFTPLRQSRSIQTLGEIFRDKVVPLLQEYFYDDYEKICLVLGDKKRPEHQRFFKVETADLQSLFGTDLEFEVNPTYHINPAAFFDVEVYRNL